MGPTAGRVPGERRCRVDHAKRLSALLADVRVIALCCVLATLALYSLPWLLSPLWFVGPLAICLRRFPARALIACVLLLCAWASLVGQWQMADRLPASADGTTRWVSGIVSALPEPGPFRTRFMIDTGQRPDHLRLSWYDDAPDLRPGDCLRVRAKLSAPHGSANPGGFDYEQWLWREGIDATGYIKDSRPCDRSRRWMLAAWRGAALARIAPYVRDRPMRGIVEALTLGERGHITDSQWRTLRATGTTHLVAISGLHVGLVAGLLFFIVRWLVLRLPIRWPARSIATGFAIIGALIYAALAGWALPTQRAVIMVSAVLLALAVERQMVLSRALAWAALAVVVWAPSSVLAPGFWLSFGAVAWLIVLSSRLGGPLWLRAAGLQVGLVAALMPLTLWFFAQASLVAPLVNAVLIPLAGLVVPVVLIAVIATLIWPALFGPGVAALCALLGKGWPILVWCATWPMASFHHGMFYIGVLICLLVGGVWLLSPLPWRIRWLGLILLLPVCVAPSTERLAEGGYRLAVLDVGQGLASVVRTAHHTLVFDTGPAYRTGFDAGRMIVVPYLRYIGRPHIDQLMLSHADMDHAGGAPAINKVLSVEQRSGAKSHHPCRAGQHWHWDGVDFSVLYPTPTDARQATSNNAHSCVLRIQGAGGSVLMTGDIESAAEARLVARYGAGLASDVLVVPHHGSNTSSSASFLAAVHPRLALISAGWHNRWGFPRKPVIDRLHDVDSRVLNTATGGALRVLFPAGGQPWRVRRWRDERRRFWALPNSHG